MSKSMRPLQHPALRALLRVFLQGVPLGRNDIFQSDLHFSHHKVAASKVKQ